MKCAAASIDFSFSYVIFHFLQAGREKNTFFQNETNITIFEKKVENTWLFEELEINSLLYNNLLNVVQQKNQLRRLAEREKRGKI